LRRHFKGIVILDPDRGGRPLMAMADPSFGLVHGTWIRANRICCMPDRSVTLRPAAHAPRIARTSSMEAHLAGHHAGAAATRNMVDRDAPDGPGEVFIGTSHARF